MRIAFDEVRNNKIRSWLLILLFLGLIGLLGIFFGLYIGDIWFGSIIALFVGGIYALIAYNAGGNMVLSISGAKPVTKLEYPHLYHAIEGIAIAAGIPAPKAYVIQDASLNAFATGKNYEHAAICVTTGLMEKLNRQELEGVIAHEMAHVKNFDIRVMMLAAVLVGVVTLLSDLILRSMIFGGSRNRRSSGKGGSAQLILIVVGVVLAILAPLIGELIRLAVSRKREFVADADAVVFTRYPKGLADALRKIAGDPDPLVETANKATAHMFISTPFRKKKGGMQRFFSTHPPIEDRIKRLDEM